MNARYFKFEYTFMLISTPNPIYLQGWWKWWSKLKDVQTRNKWLYRKDEDGSWEQTSKICFLYFWHFELSTICYQLSLWVRRKRMIFERLSHAPICRYCYFLIILFLSWMLQPLSKYAGHTLYFGLRSYFLFIKIIKEQDFLLQ